MDPMQLQRLVDGELSFEQMQQVLRAAQEAPEQWQAIASRFVEEQMWRSQFLDEQVVEGLDEKPALHVELAAKTVSVVTSRWLALAASLLLAISVGFSVMGPYESPSQNDSLSTASRGQPDLVDNAIVGSGTGVESLNQSPAVYRMQLQDSEGNPFLDSDVPLYPVRSSEFAQFEKYIDNDAITNDARRRAASSGYDLHQNVRYLSGRFNDGRRFVIPVRKYSYLKGQ